MKLNILTESIRQSLSIAYPDYQIRSDVDHHFNYPEVEVLNTIVKLAGKEVGLQHLSY